MLSRQFFEPSDNRGPHSLPTGFGGDIASAQFAFRNNDCTNSNGCTATIRDYPMLFVRVCQEPDQDCFIDARCPIFDDLERIIFCHHASHCGVMNAKKCFCVTRSYIANRDLHRGLKPAP